MVQQNKTAEFNEYKPEWYIICYQILFKLYEIASMNPKRQKTENISIDIMGVLSVVLHWLAANPPWATSNLALTCHVLYEQCRGNIRTNRCDVSLENLEWFELLGESRYWLCVYAADCGKTDFIDAIITSDQVTTNTFEEFLFAIAKRDDTQMLSWAKKKFPYNDWSNADRHFTNQGAVKILENNRVPIRRKYVYDCDFEAFMRLRNHSLLTKDILSDNVLNTMAQQWPLRGVQYLHENWVNFDVKAIYKERLIRKDPHTIDWIWETFSSTVDLKKITTDIVMSPTESTRYDISLSVFKVLHKRCNFNLSQIQALPIDIFRVQLRKRYQKILIWILETTNYLPEANYFCLLCSKNIRFERLEQLRKFNFTKDQTAYLESIGQPQLIKKLLDCNFPQTSRLVEIAISKENISLCELYSQYPKLRQKFHWPTKVGAWSEVKFFDWLENVIPIDESNARALAETSIASNNAFIFKWLLDRIPGDYERLEYLIQDYYDDTLAFAMVLYRKQKIVLNIDDSYEFRHRQIVLDFWSDYPDSMLDPECMYRSFNWDLVCDFETYKKWESYSVGLNLDTRFRDSMPERDFQLYLQTKNKSGKT